MNDYLLITPEGSCQIVVKNVSFVSKEIIIHDKLYYILHLWIQAWVTQ